ncbi:MAG: transketolase [Candidatus Methanomethylophilus sp.]|nr:transketolase [Methanomethylophilus sp.]
MAEQLNVDEIQNIANKMRLDVIEMTTAAGSGHPGGSLSAADAVAALYFRIMNIDPADPYKDDRDRFVLSKGHAAPILYAALAERGYFPTDELKTLRKIGSRLQGHPAYHDVPGVEVTTGSLGQGLSMACGIALAGKMDGKSYRTYCLLGDGELQEGQNWEAAMFAHAYGLSNLTALVDRNRLQISGNTEEVMGLDPLPEKFRAFGWNVIIIDGHNMRQILEALDKAAAARTRPTVIIMKTVKGKGVSFMENNAGFHGRACNDGEQAKALEELKAVIQ